MRLFLTPSELQAAREHPAIFTPQRWINERRADRIAANPGCLAPPGADTEWPHHVMESMTTVAAAFRIRPDPVYARWLRAAVRAVSEQPEDVWIGPWFRNHDARPARGHLETAHIAAALALALDLADNAFDDDTRALARDALRGRALPLCREGLRILRHATNWRCVLAMGVVLPAAVLDDTAVLAEIRDEYPRLADLWQPDGSYGESLQYGNYAGWSMALVHETLLRAGVADELPAPYAGYARWAAYSLVTVRARGGIWGDAPRPRSVNFNDSGAMFAPSPDFLWHIVARAADTDPASAAWAAWLARAAYPEGAADSPLDRSSFGFVPRFGFLTLALAGHPAVTALASASDGASPFADAPRSARFSTGPCIFKGGWEPSGTGISVAMNAASDPLHTVGHTHADLGAVVMAYAGASLLADPGHACYRNVGRSFDTSTPAHNTVHFLDEHGRVLGQSLPGKRGFIDDVAFAPPVARKGRFLLHAQRDDIVVFGHDIADVYDERVNVAERWTIIAGGQAVFVADRIVTTDSLRTVLVWLADNRDDALDIKVMKDRLVLRRAGAGLKLFVIPLDAKDDAADRTAAWRPGRSFGAVHDAYHPLPGCPGEGRSGSGLYFTWTEPSARAGERRVVSAVSLDTAGRVAGWHLRDAASPEGGAALESPGGAACWSLSPDGAGWRIAESVSGRTYRLAPREGVWSLDVV